MVYPSRVSVALAVIVIGAMVFSLCFLIYQMVLEADVLQKKDYAVLCVTTFELLIAGMIVWGVLFRTRYIIEGTKLEVKVAILHAGEGDLTKLESIVPTRTLWSAPASSLRRIRLDFSDGTTLVISPRRQQEFLAEVKKINPKVIIDETLC